MEVGVEGVEIDCGVKPLVILTIPEKILRLS